MSLTTNLVSYYKFQGNSNDSVGSVNGSDTTISYNDAYGIIGNGANFNGSSLVNFGNNLGATLAGAFTVNIWVNVANYNDYYEIIGKENSGTLPKPMMIYLDKTTGYVIYGLGNGSTQRQTNYLTAFGTGWHMLTATSDGSGTTAGMGIYIDASSKSLSAAGTNTTPGDGTDNLNLGQGYNGNKLAGDLDELGIWSRVLTGAEITSLYNSGAGLQYPFTGNSVNSNFLMFM